jgi:hypothetical protein
MHASGDPLQGDESFFYVRAIAGSFIGDDDDDASATLLEARVGECASNNSGAKFKFHESNHTVK